MTLFPLCLEGGLRCLEMKVEGVLLVRTWWDSVGVTQRGQHSPSSFVFTSQFRLGHFFRPHFVSPFWKIVFYLMFLNFS
jgi:hypothetical protein